MNLKQAHEALIAAGYDTRLLLADDESTDDAFAIGEGDKVQVQVSATRNGLHFSAAVESGEGDDWGVTFGKLLADPVAAAKDAIRIARVA